jgi:metal-responsive CopG/Arc/MetJ family transcriptional regulator
MKRDGLRVVVRMPSHLIERIDAYCGAPMVAQANRTSKRVSVFVPQEFIEDVDALRAALGLRSRPEAVRQLIEDGLKAKGFGLS